MRGAFSHIRASGFTSAGVHLGIIVLAQFGLPFLFTPPPVTATVIPVEVVRLDDVTRPPPAATPEPIPESTREATPQAPPRPPQPVPEPPKPPEVKPVAKAEPTPPPPPPVVTPPKPKPAPPVAEPEPPKPDPEPAPTPEVAKVTPKAKPKPPEPKRDFDSILKDLSADKTPKKAPERSRQPETVTDKGTEAPEQSQVAEIASIRERDLLGNMIREQISRCWSPPPGARDADTLLVSLEISVDPAGNVLRVNVIDATRMAVDRYFRSAAEAAQRAVLKCAPLELPTDKYEIWKQIRFNFDPSKMLS